jgi:LysR family transcriptional regulator, cell division regulator
MMGWMQSVEATDLAVFAAVAGAGTITRAAEGLHTVQSNVTARLRRLEQELGVALFHRHARGVSLTSAGEQLLPYAVQVGRLIEEAKRVVMDRLVARGPLRIGSLETTAALRLPTILAAFSRECPLVDLTLITGTTGDLIEKVLTYQLEGAFVAGPVTRPHLNQTVICEEELVVISSPAFASLEQALAGGDVKVLVLREGCSYRARLELFLRECGQMRVRYLELGTVDGILGCAAAGLGLTLLPRVVAERAQQDGRVALHALPHDQGLASTVFIRREDAFVSASLKNFIECALASTAKIADP